VPHTHEQAVTVRIPATARRARERHPDWTATIDTPAGSLWHGHGRTPTHATTELSALIAAALARIGEGPVVVIGGDHDYHTCLHLIIPDAYGYPIHIIRDGAPAGTWIGGDTSLDQALQRVLDHVGGQPHVVRL